MQAGGIVWALIGAAFVAANLPWLSQRFFFIFSPPGGRKVAWMRLLEWLVLYFIVGGVGMGLEKQYTGLIHHQGWVFYVVTFCLFLVFALPGFIYRNDLRRHLDQRS